MLISLCCLVFLYVLIFQFIIEIDPKNVWIDYGQEIIGKLTVSRNGDGIVNIKTVGRAIETTAKGIAEQPQTVAMPTGFAIAQYATTANISLLVSLITLSLVGYIAVSKRL